MGGEHRGSSLQMRKRFESSGHRQASAMSQSIWKYSSDIIYGSTEAAKAKAVSWRENIHGMGMNPTVAKDCWEMTSNRFYKVQQNQQRNKNTSKMFDSIALQSYCQSKDKVLLAIIRNALMFLANFSPSLHL